MNLILKKALVFIDLETTGLSIGHDRIVEICILKINPDHTQEIYTQRVNPEMHIPAHTTSFHGLTNEMVQNEPTFSEIAGDLIRFIADADLSGYNIMKFDLPLLMEEFLRVDKVFDLEGRKVIDVQHIFHKMEKRDLASAYQFYCNKPLVNHHSAEADTLATHEILLAQIEKYENIGKDVESLYDFTGRQIEKTLDLAGRIVRNEKGEAVFNFGKYKGKRLSEVFEKDSSYYSWIMKGDFPAYTKKKLTELILKWKSTKEV
jgi:DNA polymerase III subunit epsilon